MSVFPRGTQVYNRSVAELKTMDRIWSDIQQQFQLAHTTKSMELPPGDEVERIIHSMIKDKHWHIYFCMLESWREMFMDQPKGGEKWDTCGSLSFVRRSLPPTSSGTLTE